MNRGGEQSLIRLPRVPELERQLLLEGSNVSALFSWRARPGEILTAVDPHQNFYRVRVSGLSPDEAGVVPFRKFSIAPESPLRLVVFQALPERERFELILQKLTEIGVSAIVPFVSRRSATQEELDSGQKKSHRWPDVVLRAAKQCRRGVIPALFPVLSWSEALSAATVSDLKLMLFEGDAPWALREILRGEKAGCPALLVGPEGGFADEEVEEAQHAGFLPVTLGPRILRTETAAILGAALIQHVLGDLG